MPSPPRALLFDLDGTLVDSLADIAAAMNFALTALGFSPHPPDAYRGWVGDGVVNLAQRALPAASRGLAQEAVTVFRRYYAEHLVDFTVPYPGIPELLANLDERGVAMAVLSNKLHETTCGIVERVFGPKRFQLVLGERTGVPKKPSPVAALEVASRLSIPPEDFAFVGDTAIDMGTALAAGMLPVGVSWGFRGEEEVRRSGAVHVLHKAEELLSALFP